jgi:molybdopterin converting factor small subunit
MAAVPSVKIPPPYRGPTRGVAEVKVEGATVRACLAAVEALYPGFLPQVLDPAGDLHRFVRLFLNGDELGEGALATPVGPGDELEVLAAIAGG